MKRRVVWSVLLGLALTAPVRAQPAAGTAGSQATAASPGSSAAMASARPRVGLALSGGGARGFAHVGILRVLEQMRVPVDCIAGTSAGAAVAGAYAIGLTPDEIEARLRGVDWNDIFADGASRENQTYRRKNDDRPFQLGLTFGLSDDGSVRGPPGLSAGHKVELFLHELLGVSRELLSHRLCGLPRSRAGSISMSLPRRYGSAQSRQTTLAARSW